MSTQTNLKSNQAGIAHLGLILLFVAVIGIVGAVGYRVYQSSDTSDETATVLTSSDPVVGEDQDADGEILPAADTEQEEPADINGENTAETEAQ